MVIELGILSYKLIIPLLYPIFNQLTKINFITRFIGNSPLLNSLMRSASYLLGGLIYLFVLYRSRHIKNSSTSINFKPASKNKHFIYVDPENDKKKKKKKIISIFLLSLFNMIPIIINTIFLKKQKEKEIVEDLEDSFGLTSIFFTLFFQY